MILSIQSDFIKSTVDSSFGSDVLNICNSLSDVVQDYQGMITTNTANKLTTGLQLVEPYYAIVPSDSALNQVFQTIEPYGGTGPSYPSNGDHFPQEQLDAQVSLAAFSLYQLLASSDTSVTYYGASTIIDELESTYILEAVNMPLSVQASLYMTFIDTFALYRGLLYLVYGNPLSHFTQSDLTRMDNNIRWLSRWLENTQSGLGSWLDFLHSLRVLQRTLAYVKTMSILFDSAPSQQINAYYGQIGASLNGN